VDDHGEEEVAVPMPMIVVNTRLPTASNSFKNDLMNQRIDIDLVKELILESATDDMTGLYEVIWELNGNFPDITKIDKISVARVAMKELLQRKSIQLYQRFWGVNGDVLIDNANWDDIIDQNKSWEPPDENGLYYCFFETESTVKDLWKLSERIRNGRRKE
jgi:hypothetical protein